ncbi:MAG: sigma 54-interacting transcriptional regulator [Algicola sp.]|nr:sigma 54-interacting transcriptional regulator [Algicola sp.]
MRLDIYCQDRVGITLEILAVIDQRGWDLGCVEMYRHHAFILINEPSITFATVQKALKAVEGVISVTRPDLLPSERRRKHLDALLSKLPDPIVDINAHGGIMAANRAAAEAFAQQSEALEGQNISKLIDCSLDEIFKRNAMEVACAGKLYLLDVTQVYSESKVSGAVIVFRSPARLGQEIAAMQAQKGESIESMIVKSQKMKTIVQQTRRFAALDLAVLIRGETGTGKELLARALHESGPRAKQPFLAINCATLPENLLESELFGYAAGAFTGAQRGGKPGLVELADKGTIFLDEIGEMSVYLQAKLLRFVQELTFRRIGGTSEMTVNVRIVCATHKDLEQMTQSGHFREDLFYRLNVLNLYLPPLRERREDVTALVKHFALNASKQINQHCPTFSKGALALLSRSPWPGNIRQLQNVIFRTLALTDKKVIDTQDICLTANEENNQHSVDIEQVASLDETVDEFEANLLRTLFVQYPSTRKLAKRLDVSHTRISRKLSKYGII